MASVTMSARLPEVANEPLDCARCARSLAGRRAFLLEAERRCLRCALQCAPLLRRSSLTALVVGTLLVAINQGNLVLGGSFPPTLAWQIPLTYAVPFCVATWGALMNSTQRSSRQR